MIADVSEEEMKEALKLLKSKREKERKEKKSHDTFQRNLKNVFERLGVDEDRDIKISRFWDANTLIHEDQIWIEKRHDGVFVIRGYDEAGVGVCERYSNHYKSSLVNRHKDEIKKDKSNRDILNKENNPSVRDERRRAKCFYKNLIHECPFCGVEHSSEDKVDWDFNTKTTCLTDLRYDGWNISLDDFHLKHKKYKRCYECVDLTRKEFLSHESKYFRHGDNREEKDRLKLYNQIYPATIKNTKKYFAEKRVKKVVRNRQLTNSEKSFFQMILGASKLKSITAKKI